MKRIYGAEIIWHEAKPKHIRGYSEGWSQKECLKPKTIKEDFVRKEQEKKL